MPNQFLRRFLSIACLLFLTLPGVSAATAQPVEDGFELYVDTAYCEPGYFGPFVDCTPWDGVTVSVLYETPDGTVSDACVTVAGSRTATCSVTVPYGATVTALINPAMIPAGYVLEGSAEVHLTVPDGPPEGLFGGAAFVLFPAASPPEEPPAEDSPAGGSFTLGANTAFCEPGYFGPFVDCTPWEGVTVSFVASDGSFSTSCVTSGTERAAGCSVDVPFGSTVTVSIDPAAIPAGYVLERSASVEITVPGGPPDGEFSGASFVLLPGRGAVDPSERTAEEAPPAETPERTIEEASPATLPIMPAAIYAGTCDAPLPADPVAQLADASAASGLTVGMPGAIPVATSYTELDLPFDTVLDGAHILAVRSANDDGQLVACGGLGGALDDTGAVALGLEPVGDGEHTAIVFIAPLDGGTRAAVTVFVTLPSVSEP